MHGSGRELFAGTALAGDEHRHLAPRELTNAIEHRNDRRAATEESVEILFCNLAFICWKLSEDHQMPERLPRFGLS